MFVKNKHLEKMYAYSHYFKSWIQVEHVGWFGWTFKMVTNEGKPISPVMKAQAKITEFTWHRAIKNHKHYEV